jgi:heat shock protein HslJ
MRPHLTVVLCAFLLPALTVSAQPPTLDGTAWTLSTLAGGSVVPGATLRFESGRLSGSDGCNTFRGPYAMGGSTFKVTGPLVSTMRACPPPLTAQADAVQAALNGVRAMRRDGGTLVLLDEAGAELATWAAQSQDISGTSWEVTNYNNGRQAVVGVIENTALTIEFGDNGRVTGSAGCNRFTGTYTVSGSDVTVSGVAATRKMCVTPEKVMEQEAAFLKSLTMGTRSRIDGAKLELRTAEGALAFMATRR